jgi:hypothetical protein
MTLMRLQSPQWLIESNIRKPLAANQSLAQLYKVDNDSSALVDFLEIAQRLVRPATRAACGARPCRFYAVSRFDR